MSTIVRLERKHWGIMLRNASGTINLTLPPDHDCAKLFPADRDVVYAKVKITPKGDVIPMTACKARQFLETVKKESRNAPPA